MTLQEIHDSLHARFGGDVILGVSQDGAGGDPYITIAPRAVLDVSRHLKEEASLAFDFLRLLTAVDWGNRMGVVYHLLSYTHNHSIVLHAEIPREAPALPSVTGIWPTAEWMEREAYDMMGVVFEGHPYLKRILLPLDWEGYPLRKDYKDPEEYHGIKHG